MHRLLILLIAFLSLAAISTNAVAAPSHLSVGDVFEIVRSYETEDSSTDGSTGTSGGSDRVMVRILAIDGPGTIFELDHPSDTSEQERQRDWTLPARFLRPPEGPTRLLNADELDIRLDAWLTRAYWTREQCGRWIFTWNAFKIECDPATVLAAFDEWFPVGPIEGQTYRPPLSSEAKPLARQGEDSGMRRLQANYSIDVDQVRQLRVEQNAVVREIMGDTAPMLPPDRPELDRISGTIAVQYELSSDGALWRRTDNIQSQTIKPDGVVETRTERRILERRRVRRGAKED